jgi:hypothetical protein
MVEFVGANDYKAATEAYMAAEKAIAAILEEPVELAAAGDSRGIAALDSRTRWRITLR